VAITSPCFTGVEEAKPDGRYLRLAWIGAGTLLRLNAKVFKVSSFLGVFFYRRAFVLIPHIHLFVFPLSNYSKLNVGRLPF
jgi:hypothetical protein